METLNSENVQNQSKNAKQIKVDDPLYLHSSDHSSLILVSDVLTESNYVSWSRAMKVGLEARDKYGIVNGEIEVPDVDDAKFKKWRRVNSTLILWIMNSMSRELSTGDEYDVIRNRILLMDPLPTVAKTYSMVSEVEKRRVMQSITLDVSDNTIMQTRAYTEGVFVQFKN
ncbi:hypothetical protein LIER_18889 [Lithospermum erythrorhizon]|uniref:Retrotransposon Copia-like N-terminal domain-containing protein n=1 Tax=Lithospermum erythrorhizon TaxID=34254 RepID=A0AAV3QGX9_LITER